MKRPWPRLPHLPLLILAVALTVVPGQAQEGGNTGNAVDLRYEQLASKLDRALTDLERTQTELAESQRQIHELEMRVQALDGKMRGDHAAAADPEDLEGGAADLQAAVRELEQNTQIVQAEVKQHEQTKVESSSKYLVTISGMLLLTTNFNDGAVDDVDLPSIALPRTADIAHSSLATSWRQTLLGVNAQGPSLWGAHTAADLRVDFFGGEPTGVYSTNGGVVRLRTAHVSIDWPNSSLTASLDSPLISPETPTSFMTVAQPALAWSGNLWSWSPQLAFDHSIPWNSGRAGFQLGLIDPAATESYFNQALRQANPTEAGKQPGYESRLYYSTGSGDHAFLIGVGGYYARQSYPNHERVDSWAGTADWKLPLGNHLELSGELYRGRALGGLGGGAFKDYVNYEYSDRYQGLDAEGGWAQWKIRLPGSLEANAAIGQDSAFAGEVRNGVMPPASTSPSYSTLYSSAVANRTIMSNIIFRPRTYLLLSLEYRNLSTWQAATPADHSQSIGLALGYIY